MYSKQIKSVTIESSSKCNLRCVICPVGNGSMKREKRLIDYDLFTKIIDENPQLERVNLNNWGEPLLHPKICEMIYYIKFKLPRCNAVFATNGTLMDKGFIDKIIISGLDEIQFSIDGTKETYEKIRNFAYDKLVNNILSFISERNNRSDSKIKIVVKMVLFEETDKIIKEFIDFWTNKVDRVKIQPRVEYKEYRRDVLCNELFNDFLVVLSNGVVTPCCADYEGELKLGNANNKTLNEIWIGEKINNLRISHLNKKFPEICSRCKEYESKIYIKRFETV